MSEKIREAQEKDIEQLKKLTDENFGVDFYSSEYLAEAIGSKNKKFIVYTDEDDKPVAYQFFLLMSYAQARELLKIREPVPTLAALNDDSMVGIYKSSCTDKRYRGRGIFSILARNTEEYFSAMGIKILMGNAIRHPSGFIPIKSSVEKIGFKAAITIPHPWSDIDSYCPYCQNRFCQCDAVLYVKELK